MLTSFYHLLIFFAVCSSAGWCLEVVYRSIVLKHWINPGFLTGCCLPIYGVGGTVMYFICSLSVPFIQSKALVFALKILLAILVMTLIELLAGEMLLHFYHTRLWDYSDEKFNYKGLISLKFSLCWGLCCLVYYFFLYPGLTRLADALTDNAVWIFLMGSYYGIFAVDLVESLDLMSRIRAYAAKLNDTVNVEKMKLAARNYLKEHRRLPRFSFMLGQHTTLHSYLGDLREQLDGLKERFEKR